MTRLESAKIDLKNARAALTNSRTVEETNRNRKWFQECKQKVERLSIKEVFGYHNTASSAGRPTHYELNPEHIESVKCWFNCYGNPSYVFHMSNGDTYLLIDDYGAMNGIEHLSRKVVNRKKDMFIKW